MHRIPTLRRLLQEIEAELQSLQEWRDAPPPAAALASREPFCVDTLSLPEWLQFIFLPRLHQLLDHAQPLPNQCGIAPMAEEYFRHSTKNGKSLVALLNRIDQTLVGA